MSGRPCDLAAAVIHQAWDDAIRPEGKTGPAAISNAVAFLTNRSGAWAQARDLWCDMAGIPSERVRARAIEKMAGQTARMRAAVQRVGMRA